MEDTSILKLANRLNAIDIEINNLEIERIKIIHEIQRIYPNLKDDVNLQVKTKVRSKE